MRRKLLMLGICLVLGVLGNRDIAGQIQVIALESEGFSFDEPAINNSGRVVFLADREVGNNQWQGIYTSTGTGFSTFLETGNHWDEFYAASINDLNTVSFLGYSSGGYGLYDGPSPEHDVLFNLGYVYDYFLVSNNDRSFAHLYAVHNAPGKFYASMRVPNPNVPESFSGVGFSNQLEDEAGNLLFPNGAFVEDERYRSYDINNQNQMAAAFRTNDDPSYSIALFRWEKKPADQPGTFLIEVTAKIIVEDFYTIRNVCLSESGKVAFLGIKTQEDDWAIYTATAGAGAQVYIQPMSASQAMESGGGWSGGFSPFSMNDNGVIAFEGSYIDVHGRRTRGIFNGLDPVANKIVARGERVIHNGAEWSFDPSDLAPEAYNNGGQLVLEGSIDLVGPGTDGEDDISESGLFFASGGGSTPVEIPPEPGLTFQWYGPTPGSRSGSFSDKNNWDEIQVPVNVAAFGVPNQNYATAYTVTASGAEVDSFVFGGNAEVTLTGSGMKAQDPAAAIENPSVQVAGATLTLNGKLDSIFAEISVGEINLPHSGSHWKNHGSLGIGRYGNSSLKVGAGNLDNLGEIVVVASDEIRVGIGSYGEILMSIEGHLVSDSLSVGHASQGYLLVGGQSAALVQNEISLGEEEGGSGEVRLENGGRVITDFFSVGSASGASGKLTVEGYGDDGTRSRLSSLAADKLDIVVGFDGDGELEILNGGLVDSLRASVGSTSQGSALVSGFGGGDFSEWLVADRLTVGEQETPAAVGTLSIRNGGTVKARQVQIGLSDGSEGTIRVEGGYETEDAFHPSSIQHQYFMFSVGSKGTGSLEILDGGLVELQGKSFLDLANWEGGEGSGTLRVSGIRVQDPGLEVFTRSTLDLLAQTDPEWGVLVVGGDSTMMVEDGGIVFARSLSVYGPTLVTGETSGLGSRMWVEDYLLVHDTLTITDGGQVTVGSSFGNLDPNTLEITPGGILGGAGTVKAELVISGGSSDSFFGAVIEPGSSPGTLTIDGSLVTEPGSTIVLEVCGTEAGTKYDQLVVTGDADIRGSVVVKFIENFAPQAEQVFNFLDVQGTASIDLESVQIEGLEPGFEYALETSTDGKLVTLTAHTSGVALPEPPPAPLNLVLQAQVSPSGDHELLLTGDEADASYQLQKSIDLQRWEDAGIVNLLRNVGFIRITPDLPNTFYRVVLPE